MNQPIMKPPKLSDLLRQLIEADGSVRSVAKASGIPQPCLQRFMHGKAQLSLENVQKLLDHYEVLVAKNVPDHVLELQAQVADLQAKVERLTSEGIALAKYCADGPAFFNPLEAISVEKLRDMILDSVGLNPDGTKKV